MYYAMKCKMCKINALYLFEALISSLLFVKILGKHFGIFLVRYAQCFLKI